MAYLASSVPDRTWATIPSFEIILYFRPKNVLQITQYK